MTFKCLVRDAIESMSGSVPAIDVNIDPNTPISGVSTDSRNIKSGDLFIALVGENFDGHKFVDRSIDRGAVVAVVDRTFSDRSHLPLLIVPDTLKAYQDLAHWWRNQSNLPVVAVTGSAGKTTTKELISTLLDRYTQPSKKVHKSLANHNNDIGVAQTLLSIDPNKHDFAIVEMGMRGRGEIARLAAIARPTVGVITNIGTAHIGRLGSKQAIAAAKCELLEQMPTDSIAVLNGEDQLLLDFASKVWHGQTITYGIGVGDVNGELAGNTLKVAGFEFDLPILGRHNALNLLAALAVVKALGLDWQVLDRDLGSLTLPEGRAQVHHLAGDVMILDETYNASPEAVIAALDLLADTPATRRWAILGTMKELGDASEALHAQVGRKAKELGIDRLLVLTDGESDAILSGSGSGMGYTSGDEIVQELLQSVKSGDRILFKASHSVGMDRLVRDFQLAWQKR